jgi:hypothetical protein
MTDDYGHQMTTSRTFEEGQARGIGQLGEKVFQNKNLIHEKNFNGKFDSFEQNNKSFLDDLENSQKLNFNHLSSSKKSDRLMKDYQDMKKNYNALNNKHTALLTFVENLNSSDEVPEVQLPITAKKGSHKLVQEDNYFFPNFYRKKSTQKPGNGGDSKSGSVTMKNRYEKKGALSFSDSEKIIGSEA